MIEKWIRKIVPDYRSKRELREALSRYEKSVNVCRIEVTAKISERDFEKWISDEGFENVNNSIERKLTVRMTKNLKKHLHIHTYSVKENYRYFVAYIDVADNWEGYVTYEQGGSDR
ncbi:MAG: hypothetical protein ACI4O4_00840 [Candidatus Ventricola sp.]